MKKEEQMTVRMKEKDKANFRLAANAKEFSLSQWIIYACNQQIKRQKEDNGTHS